MSHNEFIRELEEILEEIKHLRAKIDHMNRDMRKILENLKNDKKKENS